MPISAKLIESISQKFLASEANHGPIEPVTSFYPEVTLADCYQIQQAVVAGLKEKGYKIVGKKGGFTSAASQGSVGLEEPVYGCLFNCHDAIYGDSIDGSKLINAKLECEIAFFIGKTLTGPNVTVEQVLNGTEAISPAFEVVDFRTREWAVSKYEAVAYNVFARHFVVGEERYSAAGLDLPNLGVVLNKNGTQVATGSGQAVLENPAQSLAWLVNKLGEHGQSLEAGEVVITGSMTPPLEINSGDSYEAVFDELGTIIVDFS